METFSPAFESFSATPLPILLRLIFPETKTAWKNDEENNEPQGLFIVKFHGESRRCAHRVPKPETNLTLTAKGG